MRITSFITEDLIRTNLESEDKEELFEELIAILGSHYQNYDTETLLEAISTREEKMSTGIGDGVAIPHGKTPEVEDLCGVIGISKEGIDYDSLDGEPVYVVFLLLAPQDSAGPHIKALQKIAVLMKDRGLYKRLCDADSAPAAHQLLVSEENRLENEA